MSRSVNKEVAILQASNPSIERTNNGKPLFAAHVKRWAAEGSASRPLIDVRVFGLRLRQVASVIPCRLSMCPGPVAQKLHGAEREEPFR